MLDQEHNDEDLRGFDDFDLTLGDKLRGERATMGKSLADISDDLKIREEFLHAIEASDVSGFPSASFVAGYVRSYAEYLGLDGESCFKQFCAESGFVGLQSQFADKKTQRVDARTKSTHLDTTFANPYLSKKGLDHGLMSKVSSNMVLSLATVFAFLVGLGFLGYTALQEVQRVTFAPVNETISEVGAPSRPIVANEAAQAEISLSEAKTDQNAQLTELYRPTSLETPILTPRVGPISNIDPQSLGIYAVETVDEESPVAPVATVQAPSELLIYAEDAAWVRVYTEDKSVIFEKILNKGESYLVPKDIATILRAGNSGSVYFHIDGEFYGPAGKGGSVVDDIVLTMEAVKSDFAMNVDFVNTELTPPVNAELASVE